MQFLRKAALTAVASLLTLSLFSFGLGWSLLQVFGTPGPVKQALDSSGIYSSVVGEVLQQHQDDKPSTGSDVPVNDPAVQTIIKQSFPPDFLQAQTEQVLDATYGWFNGSTPSLQFTIDLSGAKTKLADGIGQYAQQRLSTLPACTSDTLPTGDINVFNATCLPSGFDQIAAVQAARDQVLHGDFLKDTQLTQNSKAGDGNKTVAQQLQKGQNAFKHVKTDILLNGLVAVVLAALVIVLAATWRVGVRKVSVILITVGAVSAVLAWLSSFAAHQVVHKISSTHETNTSLQQQVATIAQTLADDLRSHWLLYGIALIVAGALALVVLKLTQPKNPIDVRPKKPSKYVAQPPSATEETPVIHKPGHRIIASAPTADQNKAPDDNDSPQHNLHI